MTLGPCDLVLCSGTLPRTSAFAERLAVASAAGFDGISMWGRDYAAARLEGLSDADIAIMIGDHGLEVGELDPAWWWLPGAAQVAASIPATYDDQDIFGFGEKELFRIAEVVSARSVNAVDVFGGDWGLDDAAEAFAEFCDRAAERGLIAHLEFLPWSRIPDLDTAWHVVRTANRPNGGVAVDAWHFSRSASELSTLRAIPGDRVLGVQLCDGPRQPEADLVAATLHDRLLPGRGEFDVVALVAALREIDAAAPLGVEVFSDALHALGPEDAARLAGDALRSVIAAARA
ncbi:MAG: sugar phosphate isomerase/epimerase family protein [Acidimicrobiales bacterium]